MPRTEIAYLGPPGTYSHLVAGKRFTRRCRLVPLPTILDVCAFVSGRPHRHGIVPIENSSGGEIDETVDILLANKPRVFVEEELSLDVKLALLGRKGDRISIVYSHFAPLEHCDTWLRRHLPRAERCVVASTALGAQEVLKERGAAALGSRKLAEVYDLDILQFPVQADTPNITVFLALAGSPHPLRRRQKTTLAVRLPNVPGSLCTFLEAFRDAGVNLSRLISRPIRGCPRQYAFLVDIDGGTDSSAVRRALAVARRTCVLLRIVGSYPVRPAYKS